MPNEAPTFTEKAFMELCREIARGELCGPERLEVIVSQISEEERPRLRQLFLTFANRLQSSPATAAEQKPLELSPELQAQLDHAEKLFGPDFMGPAQIEKAFGFRPAPEQIPAIPFSAERLERARQMGQMLVLHVDKTPDGKPMTMQNMNAMQALEGRNGRVLYNIDWKQNEDFYNQKYPRMGWRLESKDILPGSANKDEIQQMELIVKTLQNVVFEGMKMPADYKEAIDEFKAQKAVIESANNCPEASEMIEALKLSRLTRATPVEIVQVIEMYHQNTGEYLFSDSLVRTPCVVTPCPHSGGELVYVGYAKSHGMDVGSIDPGNNISGAGVSLSLAS